MFTGLAVAFAFRAGLFNIGAEGQLYMGAFAAVWVGISFNLPRIIHLPLAIVEPWWAVPSGLPSLAFSRPNWAYTR